MRLATWPKQIYLNWCYDNIPEGGWAYTEKHGLFYLYLDAADIIVFKLRFGL